MAKFKPARKKNKTPAMRGGIPCLILVAAAMFLVMLLLYYVMRGHAS
jgi:hypothetical protein